MGLRSWSERLDRRAQDTWRRPYVAPLHLGSAVAFAVIGVLVPAARTSTWTIAAVWAVFGAVALVARQRDPR